jgi:Phosphoesterase family/Putative Ig domain
MRPVPRSVWSVATVAVTAAAVAVIVLPRASTPVTTTAATLPLPAHVVVVMEENHSYADIIGNASAPYMNSLAAQGALMTGSYGVTHPSEPNYMALFAGSTFGLTADTCPVSEGTTANLGSELLAAGDTFKGYSEGLPATGSTTCTSGEYARKHSPWINFSNVPTSDSLPLTSFPSSGNYPSLPTLSFVIPNLDDDMHDGTIAAADTWLNTTMSAYATWAKTNHSLLIVTWDEDDYTENNQVPTIVVGQDVQVGHYDEAINHDNVLATLEAMYGLAPVGSSAGLSPISDIWTGSGGGTGNTVTVTDPGTRSATVGAALSLQMTGTDSASGQTLTYRATGLPAGLAISTSGLISGTPTASGTATTIVTAQDTTGATGSAAFSFDVSPAGGADTVTVTNPGSQTASVGATVSVQMHGTDSASGQSLAYAATGLPPGLSIGSASGLIAGVPTTAGTYPVTVTADDTTEANGSTTFTYTVTSAYAVPIGNANAESGSCNDTYGGDGGDNATGWTLTNTPQQMCYGAPNYPTLAEGPTAPDSPGVALFDGGPSASAAMTQVCDVSSQATSIDTGTRAYTFSAWIGGRQSQGDNAGIVATFRSASGAALATATLAPVTAARRGNNTELLKESVTGTVPAGTRSVQFVITYTRLSGTDDEGFVDDIAMSLH